MKNHRNNYWPIWRVDRCRRPRAGFTLIEVLAGTAILGGVLAAAVIAKAKHQHQRALANQQIEAATIADQWLSQQWREPESFPVGETGPVMGHDGWRWQTRVVDQLAVRALHGQVVRLEIVDPQRGPTADPLVAVELVLPTRTMPGGTEPEGERPPDAMTEE